MTVYVLTDITHGAGHIVGVYSTRAKACEYMEKDLYSSFNLTEHVVDEKVVKSECVSNAKA